MYSLYIFSSVKIIGDSKLARGFFRLSWSSVVVRPTIIRSRRKALLVNVYILLHLLVNCLKVKGVFLVWKLSLFGNLSKIGAFDVLPFQMFSVDKGNHIFSVGVFIVVLQEHILILVSSCTLRSATNFLNLLSVLEYLAIIYRNFLGSENVLQLRIVWVRIINVDCVINLLIIKC